MMATDVAPRGAPSLRIGEPRFASHPCELSDDRAQRVNDQEAAGQQQQEQEYGRLLEHVDEVAEERQGEHDGAVDRARRARTGILAALASPRVT